MVRIVNRRALHNFHILEHLEAGVVLNGGEVKSIRAGRVDLGQSYVKIIGKEAFLVNAHIPPLIQSGGKTYEPTRSRKLLLHRTQINSLIGKASSGFSLIPLSIYEKNNRFKIDVGFGKSKKEFDKRRVIKEKDHQRRVQQELRGDKF